MQLKGLVKFFTAALILISLYQLSFTFVARNVEKKLATQAERFVKAEEPAATGKDFEKRVEARYDKLTDSMQGVNVYNFLGMKKYTYQEVKEQELNLGLDLQGGMN